MKTKYLKKSLTIMLAFLTPLAFSQKNIPKKQSDKLKTEAQYSVADQVIADDLIVQGSACIGFDCVNGENFGFHTIRLKENNLRIHFDDTSNSASFPNTDWEIEANESANGAANAFSINDITNSKTPFRIEANTPTNTLYVDNAGRIGIGTATPTVGIHQKNGNTPALRFEQDITSGFNAQTWDMAGNESNFFIRDVTNGSKLPFRIFPNAPSNALTIQGATGNIGIGTYLPTEALHLRKVLGSGPNLLLEDADPAGGIGSWLFKVSGPLLEIQLDGASKLAINNTNVYVKDAILPGASSPSDQRFKNNIATFTNARNTIDQLSPKTFNYDLAAFPKYGFPKGLQYGLIAQEVEKVLPDYVQDVDFPDGRQYKTVNYIGLIPILLQSNKEQQVEINKQKNEINKQQTQIGKLQAEILKFKTLESRLATIEAKLEEQAVNVPLKTDKK